MTWHNPIQPQVLLTLASVGEYWHSREPTSSDPMSFNMSAMRAAVGSTPVRQTARVQQSRPAALSLPSFSGLSVSGRLHLGEQSESQNLDLSRQLAAVDLVRNRPDVLRFPALSPSC